LWRLACYHSLLDFAVPWRRDVAAAPHQELDLLLLRPSLFLRSASFPPRSYIDCCRQLYSNRDSEMEDHAPHVNLVAALADLTKIGEALCRLPSIMLRLETTSQIQDNTIEPTNHNNFTLTSRLSI
jgi:hypothetical protein